MTVKEYKKYYKELHKDSRKNKNWKKNWKFLLQYNYEWDCAFLLDIIIHKLRLMSEYFDNRDVVHMCEEDRLKIIKTLKHALELGEKIRFDEFDDEAEKFMQEHFQKFEKVVTDNNLVCCDMTWDSEDNKNKYFKMIEKSDKQRQKTIKEFFNTIRDNYFDWWD